MATLLSFLATLLAGLAKAWFSEQDVVQKGVNQQKLADESNQNAQLQQVIEIKSEFKPIVASKLVQHTSTNDPDFRD